MSCVPRFLLVALLGVALSVLAQVRTAALLHHPVVLPVAARDEEGEAALAALGQGGAGHHVLLSVMR